MPVKDADPAAQELSAAFAAGMNGTARPATEPKSPPPVDREAPFGREDDGTPKAPHGLTKEGKPRLSNAGRKPKEDAARVTDAQPEKPPAEAKKAGAPDYSEGLAGAANTAWFTLTLAAQVPWSRTPVLGRIKTRGGVPLTERLGAAQDRIHAQAHILAQGSDSLVASLNLAAQHNGRARRMAQAICENGGDVMWMMQVVMLVKPVTDATVALWTGDFKGQDEDHPAEKWIAQQNRDTWEEVRGSLREQLTKAAREAQELAGAGTPAAG